MIVGSNHFSVAYFVGKRCGSLLGQYILVPKLVLLKSVALKEFDPFLPQLRYIGYFDGIGDESETLNFV